MRHRESPQWLGQVGAQSKPPCRCRRRGGLALATPSKTTRPERHTVSVRLDADEARALRVAAAEQGLSMGALLARLWQRELGRRKKKGT